MPGPGAASVLRPRGARSGFFVQGNWVRSAQPWSSISEEAAEQLFVAQREIDSDKCPCLWPRAPKGERLRARRYVVLAGQGVVASESLRVCSFRDPRELSPRPMRSLASKASTSSGTAETTETTAEQPPVSTEVLRKYAIADPEA